MAVHTMRRLAGTAGLGVCLLANPALLPAETPGEFRPKPVPHPTERIGATGMKLQPPDTLPVSRAPLQKPTRKPKLASPGEPTLRGNDLIFDAGWTLRETLMARKIRIEYAGAAYHVMARGSQVGYCAEGGAGVLCRSHGDKLAEIA